MAAGRLAVLLAAAAVAAPAAAQISARMHGAPDRDGPAPERRAEWRARRQAHEAQEAADVALLLRLRPDQQAAYGAWRAALRPPEGERRDRETDRPAPQTTPQALDREQARMAEHEQRARAALDATRRFYAALSPDQQALFDALMRLRRGPHGSGMGGPHGPGGPPPPGMSGPPGEGPPPTPPGGA